MVRLNGSTLAFEDAWQVPASDIVDDGDFGASPTFFTGDCQRGADPARGCLQQGRLSTTPSILPTWPPVTSGSTRRPKAAAATSVTRRPSGTGRASSRAWGAPSTIGGTSYLGSVVALNPSTGQPIWQTGLPGPVIGSCSEDGSAVVACGVYTADTPQDMGFYLLDAATGQILEHISTPGSFLFAQPVFDGNDLTARRPQRHRRDRRRDHHARAPDHHR